MEEEGAGRESPTKKERDKNKKKEKEKEKRKLRKGEAELRASRTAEEYGAQSHLRLQLEEEVGWGVEGPAGTQVYLLY